MRVISFGLSIVLLAGAGEAWAQSRPAPFPTIEIATQWQSQGTGGAGEEVPAVRVENGGRHTVTGFAIGAAIGMAAGWLFYNAMCEAVNNNCSDSRVRLVLVGGVTGGALGALIGSVSE